MLDRRDLLDPAAGPAFPGRPGGDAVGRVSGGADRFSRDHDQTRVERRVVDGDASRALRGPRTARVPAIVEGRPAAAAARCRGASGGRRADGGARPRNRSRSRCDRGSGHIAGDAGPVANARASATVTSGVDASSRPTRKFGPNDRSTSTPAAERDETGDDRDQGRHGGDDTRRARKGPKEPPRHVGVEAISAVSDARPLRAAATISGDPRRRSMAVVHEHLRWRRGCPPLCPQWTSGADDAEAAPRAVRRLPVPWPDPVR